MNKRSNPISHFLVSALIDSGTISTNQYEAYMYCANTLLETLTLITLLIISGIVLGELSSVILLLLFLAPIRSFCGGAHAHSTLSCMILSYLTGLGIILISSHISLIFSKETIFPFLAFVFLLIFLLSPVDSKNKPIDKKKKAKYKFITGEILFFWEVIITLFNRCFVPKYINIILITSIIILILLVLGIIINKNNKQRIYEEQ